MNVAGLGSVNYIDVGSSGGLTPPWRTNAWRINFLLDFEPRDHAARTRNRASLDTAVWSAAETRPFYVSESPLGSSLLKQNIYYVREHWEDLREKGPPELAATWFDRSATKEVVTVDCKPLDAVVGEFDLPFHFIKSDVQGGELEVLRGATGLLAGPVVGLQLELFTVPLYEGLALMDEVVGWLDSRGFELVLKMPVHGTFDSQHDCVFLHRDRNPKVASTIRSVYRI